MKKPFPITTQRFLVAACVALALPLSAMAFPEGKAGSGGSHGGCDGMRGSHGMKGGPMPMIHGLHRLDLSDAQEDKIFDIMHAQAPAARDQMRALRKSEDELRKLKAAPDYSDAKAKVLIDQIAKQRADMEMSRLQNERKVLDVLTPEQRKQLTEMKPADGKPGKRGDRGERRAPPPPPAPAKS